MVAPIVAAGLAIAAKKIAKVAVRKLTKQKQRILKTAIKTSGNTSKEFKTFATKQISRGANSTNVISKWKKK